MGKAARGTLPAVELAERLADDIQFFGGERKDPVRARQCYDSLCRIASDHPGCPDVHKRLVKGALGMTRCHAANDELGAIEAIDAFLGSLGTLWPDDLALRHGRSELAVTLSVEYAGRGDDAAAERAYQSIVEAAETWPADVPLAVTLAKAKANLVALRCDSGRVEAAEEAFEQLKTLAALYPERGDIRHYRACGSFNLMAFRARKGDVAAALALLDDMVALARGTGCTRGLLSLLADAGFTLVTLLGEQRRFDAAAAGYRLLAVLAESCPEDASLQVKQASAAFNLVTDYCRSDLVDRARPIYEDVMALSVATPDPRVATLAAKTAVNLVMTSRRLGARDLTTLVEADMRALCVTRPECVEARDLIQGMS